jgi:hypothetical protein
MTNSTMSTFPSASSTHAATFGAMSQNMSEMFPRNEVKPVAQIGRKATIARIIANGVSVCLRNFMAGLHETRRRQAALVLVRYRHLIGEDDSRSMFKTNSTTKNRK